MKQKIRKFVNSKLGYWFYKSKHLPIGTDIAVDLKEKVNFGFKTIFDVGANVGQTAHFYRELFPESSIYCFEPIPAIFDKLKANLLSDTKTQVYQKGVGSTLGKLKISLLADELSQQHSFNTAIDPSKEHIEVDVTTIDAFMEENNIQSIDLLKIDTEGFEKEVIEGASNAILSNKIKAIYLEVGLHSENKHNSPFSLMYTILESKGFTFFGLYEISHIGIQAKVHYGNALFIHNSVLKDLHTWQLS